MFFPLFSTHPSPRVTPRVRRSSPILVLKLPPPLQTQLRINSRPHDMRSRLPCIQPAYPPVLPSTASSACDHKIWRPYSLFFTRIIALRHSFVKCRRFGSQASPASPTQLRINNRPHDMRSRLPCIQSAHTPPVSPPVCLSLHNQRNSPQIYKLHNS